MATLPDPLLDAVHGLCRLHGVAASHATLQAGLPQDGDGLTIALAERALANAGLQPTLVRSSLETLAAAKQPAILLMKDRGACILLGISRRSGQAHVLLPEAGMTKVRLTRDELEARYTGAALLAQPKFRFDERTRESRPVRHGHWFWGAVVAQRGVYRDVLLAATLVNLFAVALPMFTMNVYDRVVPNAAIETLWALAIGVSLVIAADLVMRALRSRFVDEASARIDVDLSARLLQKVLNMRLEHRPASVGSFAATLRGFEQVRDFIASSTVTALIDLPFGLLFLALIVWISPWLALPVLVAFVLTVAIGWGLQHRLHALAESTSRTSAQRNATLIESLSGLETIKAQGAEGGVQAKWERANAHLATVTVTMRALSSKALLSASWLTQMCTVATVVVGVYLISERQLTMGALIAVSMLSSRALAPAGQVVGLLMQFQGARTALDSLDALMAMPVERPESDGDAAPPFVARSQFEGAIKFNQVSFCYPGRQDPALRDVSFEIKPGEIVAFIGRAGSGKSTIQRLAMGLYQPTGGAVLVDGIDIRQIDPADLRRHMACVGQDALLFYGTLRENIALGHPHAEDAEVIAAAHAAGLGPFIDRHPQGLNLPVGERGELLSGGQRQAIALARALLHGGPMLLLDEPTSAMDQATEGIVMKRLAEVSKGRTVLLSTHRRSMLAMATRLIVIDDGRVIADGPRESILAAMEAPAANRTVGGASPTASISPAPGVAVKGQA